MGENWVSQYDQCIFETDDLMRDINDLKRLTTAGDSASVATKTSIVKRKVQQVTAFLSKLESDLKSDSNAYLISDKEVLRRQELVNSAKTRVEQCLTAFRSMDNRESLLGNSGGSSRAWGVRTDVGETEETKGYSTRQLVQQQSIAMQEQDRGLDAITASIRRQKQIALAIGDEVDRQDVLIDGLGDQIDRTTLLVNKETRHVMEVTEKVKTGGMCCCIFLLIVCIIVLAAVPQ